MERHFPNNGMQSGSPLAANNHLKDSFENKSEAYLSDRPKNGQFRDHSEELKNAKHLPTNMHGLKNKEEKVRAMDAELLEDTHESFIKEIKLCEKLIKETAKQQIEDIKNIEIINPKDDDLIYEFKVKMAKKVEKITEYRKELIEVKIPKSINIMSNLQKLHQSKKGLEEMKQEMEGLLGSNPGMAEKIKLAHEKLQAFNENIVQMSKLGVDLDQKIRDRTRQLKDMVEKDVNYCIEEKYKLKKVLENRVLEVVKEGEKKAQSVELCMLLDRTHLKKKHILKSCEKINHILSDLGERFKYFEVSIALVIYCELDGVKRFTTMPFTKDMNAVYEFLASLGSKKDFNRKVKDINGVVQEVVGLKWQRKTRLIIHVSEHVSGDIMEKGDKYIATKDPIDKKMFDKLEELDIEYFTFKIDFGIDQALECFTELFEKALGFFVGSGKKEMKGSKKFHNAMVEHISMMINRSIKKTLKPERKINRIKVNDPENKDKKELHVVDAKKHLGFLAEVARQAPQWDNNKLFGLEINVKITYIQATNRVKDILKGEINYNSKNGYLMAYKAPFSKSSNYFYHYCMIKPFNSSKSYNLIVKRTRNSCPKNYYLAALKKNKLATIISEQFNKLLLCSGAMITEHIFFSQVLIGENLGDYYIIEGYIGENLEVYTDESTYVNENADLITAFSHFSYAYTKGKIMIVDLKGHNNLLADPTVHSFNKEYEEHGDLGLKGMLGFFRNHDCNKYCKMLSLDPHEAQKERMGSVLREELKFDVSKLYHKCRIYCCNENSGREDECQKCKGEADILDS